MDYVNHSTWFYRDHRLLQITILHALFWQLEYRELYESVEYLCRKRQCDRIQSNSKYVFPQYVSGNYVHNFRILKVVSESKESVIEPTCVDNNHHARRIEYDKHKSAWDELHCQLFEWRPQSGHFMWRNSVGISRLTLPRVPTSNSATDPEMCRNLGSNFSTLVKMNHNFVDIVDPAIWTITCHSRPNSSGCEQISF